MTFEELDLNDNVLDALYDMRFETCTPIQEHCIPQILEGKDILGVAQTGTGKTAAYLLPIMSMLDDGGFPHDAINCIIMAPTRELAQQIDQAMQGFGYYLDSVSSLAIYGGNDGNRYDQEIKSLRLGADIIIATPGRFISHIQLGNVDLSKVSFFVLDEADRMLDMGFIDDIETIVAATPESRQTLLFSATWDGAVGKLARKLTKNPEVIEIERAEAQGKIEEQLLYCDDKNHKNRLLDHILRDANIDQCVIFTATKAMTETLADELYEKGFAANCLHGDMPQGWRNRTLMDVRKGRCKILVATDVAARGIDVPTITHVINYDLPKQAEDYVHRIGRTGRAGRTGIAVSFADAKEYMMVHKIERYINRKLPEMVIEGMEPTRKRNKNAERKPKGKGGWGGKRGEGERWGSRDKKPFGEKKFGGKREGGFKKEGFKKDGFKAKPKGKFRD